MKFNFRKVASVFASAVMLSSTVGFAAAATYPAPFVSGGTANAVVVYGAEGSSTDAAAALEISNDLSGRVTDGDGTVTVTGEYAKLSSGSNYIYLKDHLNGQVSTVSDNELPTILMAQTFTSDDSTDYKFDQILDIGSGSTFELTDSDNDLDNPVLHIELPTSPSGSGYLYRWRFDFDTALAFNDSDSEGEKIVLAGKEYTIATSTDSDTIVLLGGSDQQRVNVGETVTMMVGSESHEVSLVGISSDTTPQASISIDGVSETFTQGQSKEVNDIEIFADTVFRTGDNSGYAIVQLGADKLTLETGDEVQVGSDADDVDGTLVTITGGVGAVTSLTIAVSAEDNDVDHLLKGESFVDPVFGTIKLDLSNIPNAPETDNNNGEDMSSTRRVIEFSKASNNAVQVNFEDKNGDSKTIEFADGTTNTDLEDDDSNDIVVVEGERLVEDSYTILNSGDYQHFIQVTNIDFDVLDGTVKWTDVFSGDDYEIKDDTDLNSNGDVETKTISGRTYSIEEVDKANNVTAIYSEDYCAATSSCHRSYEDGSNMAVYPYLETVAGKDFRVAFTDTVQVLNAYDTTGAADSREVTLEFPTGSIIVDNTGTNSSITVGTSTLACNLSGTMVKQIGQVYYNFTTAGNNTACNLTVGIAVGQNASGAQETDAGILFVEEEDNSASDVQNAVILPTQAGSTYAEMNLSGIDFTSADTNEDENFEADDYSGNIDAFGTYVQEDRSNSDQSFLVLTYPEEQMYAEVIVSEISASVTVGGAGSTGAVKSITDNEISSYSSKNLFVVGGSCINSVAAMILGSEEPLCGEAFTAATGVGSGQYIIKTVASPYNSDKIAMLVAGYEAAQTQQAVATAKAGHSTDVGEKIYPELA